MTRTQQIVMLIEAAGPLTFATLQHALGWHKWVLNKALRRLARFDVVVSRNINRTRYYAMWQPC